MGATAAYYGLNPTIDAGGSIRGKIQQVTLTTNTATGFFYGDMVSLNSGVATPVAATPTTTRNTATPLGVFIGANWTDANGRPQFTKHFPGAGYTAYNAYGPIVLQVVVEPKATFRVRADGSIARTAIGLNAQLGNFGAGSTVTGRSGVNLVASSVALTATFAVKILDIAPGPDNAAGDAYTEVMCEFNQGVHAWDNATGA